MNQENTDPTETDSNAEDNTPIRVLLVDDEPVLSQIIKLSLEKLGNFEVTLVTDPLIAVDKALEAKPDIALLDVVMPQKNGIEVAYSLRKTPGFEELPLVFLSASVMERGDKYWLNTDEGMYKEVKDDIVRSCTLLEKPVMLDQLIEVLEEALQRTLPIKR